MTFGHEELLTRHGERSGIRIVIAVHSTVLGPALGGCRMWHYVQDGDAIDDALELPEHLPIRPSKGGGVGRSG